MKITEKDLQRRTQQAEAKSNGQFTITAEKVKTPRGASINLELKNNRTQTMHHLAQLDGIRQADDFLRAFYKGLEFSELLAW